METLFVQSQDSLKDNLRYALLKADALEHVGLYSGRLGMAILFYEYSRWKNDVLFEQVADELMDTVVDIPETMSLDFTNGLRGIQWGITYLWRKGFIEGDLDEILSEINEKLGGSEEDTVSDEAVLEGIWNSFFVWI